MQFSSGKKRSTKWPEKWIWKGLGLHLGEVWDALGHLLATFGRILAIFLGVQNHIFLKHWSKMSSKRPFGWILGCFWKVLDDL